MNVAFDDHNHDVDTQRITTYSGRHINPLKPRTGDAPIVDVAHALSLMCRYAGHCMYHYSVAQHSVLVMEIVKLLYGEEYAKIALMHDAQEAFLCDIPRPIKQLLPEFKAAERKWEEVVWNDYKLGEDRGRKAGSELKCEARYDGPTYHAISKTVIKPADRLALIAEMQLLKMPNCRVWDFKDKFRLSDIQGLFELVLPIPPEEAKARFMKAYKEVFGE